MRRKLNVGCGVALLGVENYEQLSSEITISRVLYAEQWIVIR